MEESPRDISLQQKLYNALKENKLTLATAESCTGGWIGKRITDISGSSQVYLGGIISYANEIKEKFLGVQHETLLKHGAVSKETALEMARGVRERTGADIGLSVTGIAGPQGGTAEKPVGLVYIAISSIDHDEFRELRLAEDTTGDREDIRYASTENAIQLVLDYLK
ncbi:MAG: putative competence/damage-inducible protein A [Streblomastix strix]|uniref:Putative competence/damage-inducible protein A n=1 Tax=Streblomastix strix TaxID=222440 RepID=A0A5J4WP29_9EUKA|nr:MAG: putative competence/damage-inducible protein A [Streblomastix strix]